MARIYTVFTSSGLMGECQIFTAYHPDREIVSDERIVAELEARCKGVEFVVVTTSFRERDRTVCWELGGGWRSTARQSTTHSPGPQQKGAQRRGYRCVSHKQAVASMPSC